VGLSGGVDSAVVAALAARALGPRGVVAVLMPHRLSRPDSLADALALARRLRIPAETVDISPMVDPYFERFPDAGRVRRGNRMARERMNVLFDRSAAHGALVLGTSNKTELLLGYGTLFGDMASALNPLGDLYKTQVRQMAEHLGIPEAIRRKAPTADLWAGQTDEAEIGAPYAVVDRILCLLYDERWEPSEVAAAGFDPRLVAGLRRMVAASQFKRRPPLIAKISQRTVGVDFRYPRDWGT
jgi:NAD+ synthase